MGFDDLKNRGKLIAWDSHLPRKVSPCTWKYDLSVGMMRETNIKVGFQWSQREAGLFESQGSIRSTMNIASYVHMYRHEKVWMVATVSLPFNCFRYSEIHHPLNSSIHCHPIRKQIIKDCRSIWQPRRSQKTTCSSVFLGALKDCVIFAINICCTDTAKEWTVGHCSMLVCDLETGRETELINYWLCIFWPALMNPLMAFISHNPPPPVIHFNLECIRDCKAVWNSSLWKTLIKRNDLILNSLKNALSKWHQSGPRIIHSLNVKEK